MDYNGILEQVPGQYVAQAALTMADGSAKFMAVKKFLAETPTLNEYVPGANFPGNLGSNCRDVTSAYSYTGGPLVPNISLNAPLWALGPQ